MKIIGITGGIGCGKSFVLSKLKEMFSCVILSTDDIAKDLQKPNSINYDEIVKEFGLEILNEDKTICNEKLAKIVFNDKEKLEKLNNITHKNVINSIKQTINDYKIESNPKIIFIESALLFQTELKNFCDETWAIIVSEHTRKIRLKKGRNYDDIKINEMFRNQPKVDYYIKNADKIIHNKNEKYLIQKLLEISKNLEEYYV